MAGGKKNTGAFLEIINEYEKRLKKPFDIEWEFFEEEKLARKLAEWPFSGHDFVICCDERGQNISSPEFSKRLENAFVNGQNVIILIGGAYGFNEEIRSKANFLWSFSKLVFPHELFRTMVVEQVYRAQEISKGGKYHHE